MKKDIIVELPVDRIEPDPDQPRKHFVARDLEELAESIKKDGLMQAITVRKDPVRGYIIVAGERRWRAHKIAGLKTIKAIVTEEKDTTRIRILSVVENLHRKDLNPIE